MAAIGARLKLVSMQYILHYFQSLCQTRINAVADGLDNDCDGLTDEDVCFSAYGNGRVVDIVTDVVWGFDGFLGTHSLHVINLFR